MDWRLIADDWEDVRPTEYAGGLAIPLIIGLVEAAKQLGMDTMSVTQHSVAQITRPLPGISLFDLVKGNGHPDARCFVAIDQETNQLVGTAFGDLEQVSWNGKATLAATCSTSGFIPITVTEASGGL